jgi:peptidoglycan/xylan/chitin deacetylase (PgdA/CDA1 family)
MKKHRYGLVLVCFVVTVSVIIGTVSAAAITESANIHDTIPQPIYTTKTLLNDSGWSSKPVVVNIQVDLEDETDQNYIHGILNEIESHGWHVTVYVTGEFASNHPDVVRTIENRGHDIAVYGWRTGEDLTCFNYTEQFRIISNSISAVRSAVRNPKYVVDFKPQNLDYNNDTIHALLALKMKSISGAFSADEPFCKCWYAKSVGKITFPYPITTDFAAVPISDVKMGSEELLLNDREVFSKLTAHDYLSHLKEEYEAHNKTKDPMVVVVSPSVTGAAETKLQTLSQFLDYIDEKGGKVKPTAPLTMLTRYIPYLDVSAPQSACVCEQITAQVTFTAAIYCPNYYFRIYGSYPGDAEWTLLGAASHFVDTGTYSFNRTITIPQPTHDVGSYTLLVVGQGCGGDVVCCPRHIVMRKWIKP